MLIPIESCNRDDYVSNNKDFILMLLDCFWMKVTSQRMTCYSRQYSLIRSRSPPSPLESDISIRDKWTSQMKHQAGSWTLSQGWQIMWEELAAKFHRSHMPACARMLSGQEHPWVWCLWIFQFSPGHMMVHLTHTRYKSEPSYSVPFPTRKLLRFCRQLEIHY